MAMNDLSPIANLHLIMDNKLKAKFLYWLGWKIVDIAEVLNENERTVQAWKTRDDWEKEKPENRVENALTVRLMVLILKNKKTSGDIKEIDMLMRQYKEFARIEKYRNDGSEADLNPEIRKRNSAPRKKFRIILLKNKLKSWFLHLKKIYLITNGHGTEQAINVPVQF